VKAVVAGVDLTVLGRRVAERARMVAEAGGNSLKLLHVIEPVSEALIDVRLARLMGDYQMRTAAELLDWCRERSAVDVELEVTKGSPSWELVSRAKTADLTVVGSSTLDAFTAGPTARRVARMASSHVLVVRRQPRVPYRRIVVAVDFSEGSRIALDTALSMFPAAEMTVAYSLPSRFDPILSDAGLFIEELDADRVKRMEVARDLMAEFVHGREPQLRTAVLDGPTMESISEVVRARNADLVVVGSRGASATRMVLLGTVAEGMLGSAPCDVLLARVPSAFRRP
jgi:nucleotide-binding universal stress UspA family protein